MMKPPMIDDATPTLATAFARVAAALTIACALAACPVAPPPADDAGGGDGGGADGGTNAAPAVLTCVNVCEQLMASCTAENAQFASQQACLDVCYDGAAWRVGTAADTDVNTIGCRVFHVGAAATDPAAHCAHAGPTGGGVCGSYCDNYCDSVTATCAGDDALYGSRASCLAACALMPDDGAVNAASGDSVQCRIFHAQAAESDAAHCTHASTTGDGACGAACEVYCRELSQVCTGANAQFASDAACTTACAGFPTTGAFGDASGDTIQCRLFHLGAAIDDAATHCAHAGPASAGVCE